MVAQTTPISIAFGIPRVSAMTGAQAEIRSERAMLTASEHQ